MIFSGYGVVLERLRKEDLELLRTKRNSPEVQPYMSYREEITPDQQEIWFSGIDNANNNYFIIRDGHKKVGLISGSEIDWQNMITGNGGLFFWDTSYWGTNFPLCAALLLTDISFVLKFKKTRVRVLPENTRAINFNKGLGYKLLPGQEDAGLLNFELTEDEYERSTAKLKSILTGKVDMRITCYVDDPQHPSSIQFLSVFNALPEENKVKINFVENTGNSVNQFCISL